jgi:hypothetical protein
MKNVVVWDVAPCRSCVNRRFGGTYRLHLQGRKIRERGTSVNRCLQPPAHAGSSLADFSTLKMEAIHSSETSVHTRSARRHIPEDGILQVLRNLSITRVSIFEQKAVFYFRRIHWFLLISFSCMRVAGTISATNESGFLQFHQWNTSAVIQSVHGCVRCNSSHFAHQLHRHLRHRGATRRVIRQILSPRRLV